MTMLRSGARPSAVAVAIDPVNSLRRFWLATTVVIASALVISGAVAVFSGADAGKIILVSSVLVSAVVAVADGLVAIRRNRRR